MPLASSYADKTSPVGADQLIGTDSVDGTTKNFLVADVLQLNLPFTGLKGTQPFSTGGNAYLAQLPKDKAVTMLRIDCSVQVNGTNNGSNYWTVELWVYHSDGTSTKVATFNTSADGTFTKYLPHDNVAIIGGTNPLAVTDLYLYIAISTTGAPGTLNMTAPLVQCKKAA